MKPRVDDIEAAVAMAEASTGTHKPGHAKVALIAERPKRHRYWTKEEEEFLRANLGKLTIQEIARRLGRSWSAVVNHYKREMHLSVPSKDPQVITGEQVALGLSKDGKSIHAMIDKGIMPGRRLAFDRQRIIRVVDKVVFLKWMLDPMNWCRFDPMKVGALKVGGKRRISMAYDQAFWDGAAKAIRKARRKWKDEWMTSGKAGRLLKVTHHNINATILAGNLKATRHQNWWIRRSDLPKKGTFNAKGVWVPRILSHRERGKIQSKRYWDAVWSGEKPVPPRRNKDAQHRKALGLVAKGWEPKDVAHKLGVSQTSVCEWLRNDWGRGWKRKWKSTKKTRRAA